MKNNQKLDQFKPQFPSNSLYITQKYKNHMKNKT